MCDFFMEANKGDLADIVWAGNNTTGPTPTNDTWHHLASDPVDFPPSSQNLAQDLFGDPFSHTRDPLLHELPGMEFFTGPDRPVGPAQEANNEMIMKRPCNLFSRILQISPGLNTHKGSSSPLISPRERKPSPIMVARESLAGCHVDHGSGMQQISSSSSSSSPRTPGIKRRKSQAKKVVCIPAPAAATSRPSTGEVVPSDLWAWRKYGQKPIKGSPYPRGYYRCSSSKGCSARKQVERSRTDPNMLVITYTSEHNHPWPTQRNALAGSTRSSQPAKNNNTSSASKGSQPACLKEEPMDLAVSSSTSVMVKEEVVEMEKTTLDEDFDQVLIHESYKPMMPADLDQPDDFFADLAELEPDPMSLIFSKGSYSDKLSDESKAMDPFTIFDQWAGNSFGESKKGL